MKFEDSKYSKRIPYKKLEFSFGTVYATNRFIVSELNEGIHVDHEIASVLIEAFTEDIRSGAQVGYIANRMNSYSFDPQLWQDFNNDYDFLIATAIVSYNEFSYINSTIEKHFFKKSLKRCRSLDEAIEWMMHLDEFKLKISRK